MKAVFYLFGRETRNKIAGTLRKPAALIGYLCLFAFYLWIGIRTGNKNGTEDFALGTDIFYIILALISIMQTFVYVYPTEKNDGISGYRMADIALLFHAPVKNFDILMILLLRQFSAGFFGTVFLLIQAPIFKSVFGLSTQGVILYIFSALATSVFGTILMAMRVFVFRNRPVLKKIFKIFVLIMLGMIFIYPIPSAISDESPFREYLRVFKLPVLDMIPFIGWMRAVSVSPLTGITPTLAVSFFIMLFLCAGGLFYLSKETDTEWFEETVSLAEQMGIAAEKMKQGSMPALSLVKKKKPVHYTFTGRGSAAIFQKHMLEYRKTGFMFVNFKTILFLLSGGVLGWLMSMSSDPDEPVMIIALLLISFVSVVFAMFSRWKREVRSPYLYLIPDSPFRKLIMITAAGAVKNIIDGLFFFLPLCIFARTSVIEGLTAVLGYTLVNQIYIDVDILSNRIFGRINAGNFKFLVIYFVQILILVPSVVIGIVINESGLPSILSVLGFLGAAAVFYITLSFYAAAVLRRPEYFD